MADLQTLRRLAIIGVVLSVIFGIAVVVLSIAAVGNLEAMVFGDVETVLRAGPQAAPLWRAAMLADMLNSYLFLLPLALYGHRLLRDRKPWLADLGLAGALAYIFIGAASAAALAMAGSSLIASYAEAGPAEQAAITTSFAMLRDIFYFGIWQLLDGITAGTWVFTSGLLLLPDRPRLGRLLVVLGIGFWLAAAMTMLDVHSTAVLVAIFTGVVVVWLLWVLLSRGRQPGQTVQPGT